MSLKSLLFAFAGSCAAFGVLALMQGHPAQAQNPAPSPNAAVDALIARLNADDVEIAALQADNNALKAKTAPLSVSGTDLTFTGVNVHIVSGTGSTSDGATDSSNQPVPGKTLTGLGNLIIGYDAVNPSRAGDRTGSHNLIVGDHNSYSSFGGLVAGEENTVSGPYASVTGGYANVAAGGSASVSGGYANKATGGASSISGGYGNLTNGGAASISGGYGNTASGGASAVGGGYDNTAFGGASSVSGGKGRTVSKGSGWAAGSELSAPKPRRMNPRQ